jgi:low affinity Fe/Cu permease
MNDRRRHEAERSTSDRFHPKAAAHINAFERFARAASLVTGKPATFFTALALVLVWSATGPLFGFSDTWQLVINTSTTIVTFLMVFLLQHSQNRDTMALQLKLAELIIAVKGANNELATAEDLSERELCELHDEYARKAEQALKHLHEKRKDETHRPGALDQKARSRAS